LRDNSTSRIETVDKCKAVALLGSRLSLLGACEVEAEWVSRCLADFDQVWDTLSAENRGRLVRAVFEGVEVDEPNGDVRVFATNLNAGPRGESRPAPVT
jgi:hypothetical protein